MPSDILAALPVLFGAAIGAVAAFFVAKRQADAQLEIARKRAETEIALAQEKLQTEIAFAQEKLQTENRLARESHKSIRKLLLQDEWELRSFEALKRHLPAFEDGELRKLLVAAGAVSFPEEKTGRELWGLIERNEVKLAPARDKQPKLRAAALLPASSAAASRVFPRVAPGLAAPLIFPPRKS